MELVARMYGRSGISLCLLLLLERHHTVATFGDEVGCIFHFIRTLFFLEETVPSAVQMEAEGRHIKIGEYFF